MDEIDQNLLLICISKIEERYFPEVSGAQLRQRDFEYLLDLIEEKSSIKSSISTIKRIWKNKEGDLTPHPTTLNALVSILDCKDWLDFKLKNTASTPSISIKNRIKFRNKKGVLLIGLVVASVIFSAFYFSSEKSNYPSSDKILFTANKTVSKGVPSTVIFNYDISEIEADSFFIQQDWNPNHKDRISPESNFFSSIYYVPGYHKTKLIANESFLKTIPVHIQTDGWMSAAFYNYDERPVYISSYKKQNGILTSDKEDILKTGMEVERFAEHRFINIREFEGIDGHNFIAEARFRYKEFLNDPCPNIHFTIHTEAHIYYVPLTLQGCESNLEIKIGEVYKSGKDYDLSSFGTDIFNWQEISLQVKDKAGQVFLNNKQVYEVSFKEDFGDIVGLDFRSSGLSEVDYIRLKNLNNKIVYEDNF